MLLVSLLSNEALQVNDQMTTKRIDAERAEKHCIYIHVVSSTDFQRFQISRTLHLNLKSPNQALCFDRGLLIDTRSNYSSMMVQCCKKNQAQDFSL
ncbi:hypothetical protein CY34DRAFT_804043 [Suillus luteus UH-Slu-Lm8-n1]|uniref:Uncharacterized protein n=1 Tax=Suillus luteus UH-Slu-Lm8-n1 TaxID=930992 RepID=A0A0D0AZT8_9AGAM|nr:hypothetical protein CY34DRAFT_804043 [Suillus luteus UH-Slu-Lm8-n1]